MVAGWLIAIEAAAEAVGALQKSPERNRGLEKEKMLESSRKIVASFPTNGQKIPSKLQLSLTGWINKISHKTMTVIVNRKKMSNATKKVNVFQNYFINLLIHFTRMINY